MRNRYYRNAKFSEYHFKKILKYFVEDSTPTAASKDIALSLNTINTVFVRIRMHFVALGLFYDFESPELEISDDARQAIRNFHNQRMRARRGIINPASKSLHRCESQWRYNYIAIFNLGDSGAAFDQMFADLLELITISGPIGGGIEKMDQASQCILEQMARRLTWMERNSPDMKRLELRPFLKAEKASLIDPSPLGIDEF